jgi:hypothetical protein
MHNRRMKRISARLEDLEAKIPQPDLEQTRQRDLTMTIMKNPETRAVAKQLIVAWAREKDVDKTKKLWREIIERLDSTTKEG